MKRTLGLYWFTNDLRLGDNRLLHQAAAEVDELVCVYCYPQVTPFVRHYSQEAGLNPLRRQFLDQSLKCLNQSLGELQQCLHVLDAPALPALVSLVEHLDVTHLFVSEQPGSEEQQVVARLKQQWPHLTVEQHAINHLYQPQQLPFELADLPATFTRFRKQVESLAVDLPIDSPLSLPPMPDGLQIPYRRGQRFTEPEIMTPFSGGEQAGLEHCQRYFDSRLPTEYKQTRNGLDGMDYSTKFSPWLALGCVSPRTINAMLKCYEGVYGANESTYWIYFELLWRDYFYFYARRYAERLFKFGGIDDKAPLTSYYAQRFQAWKQGMTPFAIVNACMHQLRETGYMSNRGRQLVASCLIHELQIDWRYGAAYFETQLLDYDVASNWGNWQYLAGVGADPRGSRQFNLEKQTELYDPQGHFIRRWHGDSLQAELDSVDMVDWPIATIRRDG